MDTNHSTICQSEVNLLWLIFGGVCPQPIKPVEIVVAATGGQPVAALTAAELAAMENTIPVDYSELKATPLPVSRDEAQPIISNTTCYFTLKLIIWWFIELHLYLFKSIKSKSCRNIILLFNNAMSNSFFKADLKQNAKMASVATVTEFLERETDRCNVFIFILFSFHKSNR